MKKIYLIRGQKIILDRDLAVLYGVETRVLNQAVKRNAERFPCDFMLCLTRQEIRKISQFVICSQIKHAKNVYAFTEQGMAILSSVLNSQKAIHLNIAIMRAFVQLRATLSTGRELTHKLNDLERRIASHDENIKTLFNAIRALMAETKKPKRKIGFVVKEKAAQYNFKRIKLT